MPIEKRECESCGRMKPITEFWKLPQRGEDGERLHCGKCKSCLCEGIDNRDPSTFLHLLEMFDIPFVEDKWVEVCNREFLRDPSKFGPTSVIGKYLRSMRMSQFKDRGFADSDELNAQRRGELDALTREYEYGPPAGAATGSGGSLPSLLGAVQVGQDDLAKNLTDEDVSYLALKWGVEYRPSEWLTMEKLYRDYEEEFDLNADRKETLKKICRTSLKADQALAIGDANSFKMYSQVMNDLRKTGKFTEAQNKEVKQSRYLDSIGELARMAEREGGIIPAYLKDIDDCRQDSIDYAVLDMKQYTRNLVINDLGLGNLIESYVQRLEEAESTKLDMGFDDAAPEDDAVMSIEDQVAAEIEKMELFQRKEE